MMRKLAFSLAACLAASQNAFSGLARSPQRAGISCPGCAPGVVNLMLTPAFQAPGATKERLTPAFRGLSEWFRTEAGRSFLKADPSWTPLAQASLEDPGRAEGVISVALVSPLMMAAAQPKWLEKAEVVPGRIENLLIEKIQALAEDTTNEKKKTAVFDLLEILRMQAHNSLGPAVENFVQHYLLREPPEGRAGLKEMLSDVKAVAGFLAQLRLYRDNGDSERRIEQAIKDVDHRRKDLQEILSQQLMRKAGRLAEGLGKGEEAAVEAKSSGKGAEGSGLKPSRKGKELDMRNFLVTHPYAHAGSDGVGIAFDGRYSYQGPAGAQATVPGKALVHGDHYNSVGDRDWRRKLPDPSNVFYVQIGGDQVAGFTIERRPMTPSEITGFLESFETFVRRSEERARERGEKGPSYDRALLVQMKIDARKQSVLSPSESGKAGDPFRKPVELEVKKPDIREVMTDSRSGGLGSNRERDFSRFAPERIAALPGGRRMLLHGRLDDRSGSVSLDHPAGLHRDQFMAAVYTRLPHRAKETLMSEQEISGLGQALEAALGSRQNLPDRPLYERFLAAIKRYLAGEKAPTYGRPLRRGRSRPASLARRAEGPAPRRPAAGAEELEFVRSMPDRVGQSAIESAKKKGLDPAKLTPTRFVALMRQAAKGQAKASAPSPAALAAALEYQEHFNRILAVAAGVTRNMEDLEHFSRQMWHEELTQSVRAADSFEAMLSSARAMAERAERAAKNGDKLGRLALLRYYISLEGPDTETMEMKLLSPQALAHLAEILDFFSGLEDAQIPEDFLEPLRGLSGLVEGVLSVRTIVSKERYEQALPAIAAAKRLKERLARIASGDTTAAGQSDQAPRPSSGVKGGKPAKGGPTDRRKDVPKTPPDKEIDLTGMSEKRALALLRSYFPNVNFEALLQQAREAMDNLDGEVVNRVRFGTLRPAQDRRGVYRLVFYGKYKNENGAFNFDATFVGDGSGFDLDDSNAS